MRVAVRCFLWHDIILTRIPIDTWVDYPYNAERRVEGPTSAVCLEDISLSSSQDLPESMDDLLIIIDATVCHITSEHLTAMGCHTTIMLAMTLRDMQRNEIKVHLVAGKSAMVAIAKTIKECAEVIESELN